MNVQHYHELHEISPKIKDSTVYYLRFDELQIIYKTFPELNYVVRELTQRYYQLCEQQVYGLRMQSLQERYDWLLRYHPDLLSRVPATTALL